MDRLAEEQLSRYSDLKAKRDAVFMVDWQTISQYALPQDSDINVDKTEGISGWTDRIFDTTMIQAAQTLASGQYNWLTPPNQPWAQYEAPEELNDQGHQADEATTYFGRASDIAMRELARSNFYSAKAMSDLGVSVFATDLMLAEESEKGTELFNFVHCKIGTYVIEEDYRGIVDTVRRELEMTFRQIKQMFNRPGDRIPDKMLDQAKGSKAGAKKFKVLHCIFPREDSDRLPGAKNGPNKPIASVYIAIEFRECLRISGYDESPILCSRFAKWGTDAPWGYGPSYLALPDARQVNYVQQYMDSVAELHANPRVLIPDNLECDVDLRAGGVTTWDTSNPNGKPAEWATVSDYQLGLQMQAQRRKAIEDAFMVSAFKLLNSQPLLDKRMTAYEISQRQAEQLQSFTPAFTRRISEFINPCMRRVFGILYRAGKFGRPPASLMQDLGNGTKGLVMPEVVVTSRISDALRALKNRATEETFQFLTPLGQEKPELYDVFIMDDVVIDYARNSGIPAELIRNQTGPNSVETIRAQRRAQMQAQQRQVQMAEQMGRAGRGLGASPDWVQDKVQAAVDQSTNGTRGHSRRAA